jgi:two-component system, chemotaxis family, chemotaxis protein CheY
VKVTRSLTALVVDDSASLRRQLARALRRVGFHVAEAVDGADAWRRLQGTRADVILTDVNMPLLDGLKLVALVRGSGAHQRTPIVVITSESAAQDRERAIALGATDYLVKPVKPDEVARVVKRLAGER